MLNSKENLKHVSIINDLFVYLNQNSSYVVLRNYEKLPYDYGNDIDILIGKDDVEDAIAQLNEIVVKYGYKIEKIVYRYCYYGVYLNLDDQILLIDFFTDFVKGWVRYADNKLVLTNRRKYNNFFIPLPEHEVGIIIFKELLTYKIVRMKYFEYLNDKIETLDQEMFVANVNHCFPAKAILSVWDLLVNRRICKTKFSVTLKLQNLLRPVEFVKWFYKRMRDLEK